MKKKSNPHEWLQPNGESNPSQGSDHPRKPEPSGKSQKSEPDLSNKPDRLPKKLLQIVRQAGIDVKGQGTRDIGQRTGGEKQGGWEKMRRGEEEKMRPKTGGGSMKQGAGSQPTVASRQLLVAEVLPTLPDSIFPNLPAILQKVVAMTDSRQERDILLMGSLVCFGACLPKVHGYYDCRKVFPFLYIFVTAPASAGKGRLALCKQLVMPVHLLLRQESQRLKDQYDIDLEKYYKQRLKNPGLKKPVLPPNLMLFIPANSSATGVFELLFENGGRGLIFETEGDTLSQAFKADHGHYDDGLRKGAEHEAITYFRRTEREFVEILCSCIAAVLSGTPNQVPSLIPSAENGLLSRFLFYQMGIQPVWKNVFASNGHKNLEDYFDDLGQQFLPLYKALNKHPQIEFCFSETQQNQFNAFFEKIQAEYMDLQGIEYIATVRRLGLIAFRIAMILTTLRILETGDYFTQKVCSEVDFQAVLSMIRVLVQHSSHVFSELQGDTNSAKSKDRMEQFLDQLPVKFSAKDFITLAKNMSIPERSARRYMGVLCEQGRVCKEAHGIYLKLIC